MAGYLMKVAGYSYAVHGKKLIQVYFFFVLTLNMDEYIIEMKEDNALSLRCYNLLTMVWILHFCM